MHFQRSFIHPNGDWCAGKKLILVNTVAFAFFILFPLQAAKPDLGFVGIYGGALLQNTINIRIF